ncbi:hypothetical protein C1637_09945 [Chryseobacterium lactis]|uniref:Uncharacterized protein n=1 Tax=Chryseobacterium lactis TaxID=1241981 RepID=A0A3G6RH77_CHRLC|nr:phage tail tape measure protein [Chryseobacterium lactis]AZA82168.1 hypothetical protein EG342_09755 [Chryseobacterium lactis]AZB02549.1 hypothetical protein EG341_00610 [Chryseobacterium lactis]PNW14156.1 hypothetical protein C1637_09945 [Chryseobacterium lactis]
MANITKIYEVKLQGQGVVLADMKKVNKEFDDARKRWKQLKDLISQGGLSSGDATKYKEEMNQAKLETERLRQETIRLKNETLALNNANKQQTAEQKRSREETRNSTSEWKLLLKQLNEARTNAKNLGVKFGIDSSEFKTAQAEVTALDSKVKQIESRLGQFQRNVGNYPGNQMLQGLNKNTLESLVKSGLGNVIATQLNEAKNRVRDLDAELSVLKNKLDAVKTNGTGDLEAIQREIIENRNAASQFSSAINRIQTDLRNTGTIGAQVTNNLKNYFKNLKGEITGFLVGYLSFNTAIAKTQELVQNTYELSDSVTSMEVELQKAAGGAQSLVDKLAQLDTRTNLKELVNIGNIAIKAGVDENDLAGVVSGIDKIKTAFGKDFGDVETGTESLVKLINVFENGRVTEQQMLRTGNAVRTLANESVASVPFLNDFAKRMAGLKGISEITLPAVLGLASGFEQYGQSAETSSTALVRIIPKLASDTEKFAKFAKMTKKEFSDLINTNPAEALIRVAEGITKDKAGIEELIQSLGDSELAKKGGAGIVTALGVLGKNSETFRKSIKSAGDAYKDTSNITDAFDKKNQNLAAGMDKLKKSFTDMGNNKNLQAFLRGAIVLITAITGAIGAIPLTGWITLITLLTLAYWKNIEALAVSISQTIVYAARTVIGNALITASNILIRAQTLALLAANAAWRVLNATVVLFYSVIPGLRAAWISLNIAMATTPIGWILGGIIALGGAIALLSARTESSAESMKKQGNAMKQSAMDMKLNSELTKKVTDATVDTIAKIEILTRILKDNTIALSTKKIALQELININPQYLNALTLENVKTAEGTKILEAYRKKILEVARAKAVESLVQEKQKKLVELEMKATDDANAKLEADKYKNKVFDSRSWGEFARGVGGMIGIGPGDAEDVYNNNLKERIDLQKQINTLTKEQVQNVAKGTTNGFTENKGSSVPSRTLAALREEIQALTAEFDAAEIGSKRYNELDKQIKQKQAYLDSLTKTEKKASDKGSRLTGTQKDYIRDLEANKNNELSVLEKSFMQGSIQEDDYLKKSLASNNKYYDAKIAYLKKGNAEERKQESQAQLDKIKATKETNEKLYNITKKRFDDELKNEEDAIVKKRDLVINSPYSNEQEKLDAEKSYYEESTSMQISYNQKLLDLQSQYSKGSIEETNSLFRAVKEKLDAENKNNREYRIKATRVSFKVVDETTEDLANSNEMLSASDRKLVLQSKELSNAQKKIELQKISARLELQNTNAELGSVIAKIRLLELEMQKRELNNDEMREFNKLLKERQKLEGQKAEAEQNYKDSKSTVSSGIPGSGVSGLASSLTKSISGKDGKFMIGDKDYSEQAGLVIAESFNIAQQAMNDYFDAERARIEQSKQLAYERIDIETQQLQRFAQSSSERESIERQANEKKKKADKEAGEKLKKTKKAEARIAFLVELGNIWSTVMQLGPIAGPIFGAILSTLATVRFASTMANIDKVQYGFGGQFKKRFGTGGRLDNGSYHSENNGMPIINPKTNEVEAFIEKDEAIINKNSMKDQSTYTVTGTPSQIASKINSIGGGVDWDGGATMKKFMKGGTYLGSNLQPPIFRSYYEKASSTFGNTGNLDRLDRIEQSIEELAAIQKKESMRKTYVVQRDITNSQNESKKQSEIATL